MYTLGNWRDYGLAPDTAAKTNRCVCSYTILILNRKLDIKIHMKK